MVVFSAHNISDVVEITAGMNHGSKAPGNPLLALKIKGLLSAANIQCQMNQTKRFDLGVNMPIAVMNPKGAIPVVSVSLNSNLNA
jgi:aromatic ring-opening dioxygenase catalytic subunit (LigB family)